MPRSIRSSATITPHGVARLDAQHRVLRLSRRTRLDGPSHRRVHRLLEREALEVGEARDGFCNSTTIQNVVFLPGTFRWEDPAHLLNGMSVRDAMNLVNVKPQYRHLFANDPALWAKVVREAFRDGVPGNASDAGKNINAAIQNQIEGHH